MTIVPALRGKVPFDPVRDFAPISLVAGGSFGLAVASIGPGPQRARH